MKNLRICIVVLFTLLGSVSGPEAGGIGDINDDDKLTLSDVLLTLKVCAKISGVSINKYVDVNGDGRIGLAEAIYTMQILAAARPFPSTVLSSDIISPDTGGLLKVVSNDMELAGASLDIPAGAVDEDVIISIAATEVVPSDSPVGLRPVGKLFFIEPAGLQFSKESTLSLPISPGSSNTNLYIGTWDNEKKVWVNLGGTISGDFISTTITHLSLFGVFNAGHSLVKLVNQAADPPADLGITIVYISGPVPPADIGEGVPFLAYRPLPAGGVDLKFGHSTSTMLLPGRYHFVVSYPHPQPGVANSLDFTIPELAEGADDGNVDQTITITLDGATSTDTATNDSIIFAGANEVPGSNKRPTVFCTAEAPAGIPVITLDPKIPQLPSHIVGVGPIKVEQLRENEEWALTMTGNVTDPEGSNLRLFWTWSRGTIPDFEQALSGSTVQHDFNREQGGLFHIYLTVYDEFWLFDACRFDVQVVPNNTPLVRVVPDDFIVDFGRLDDRRIQLPLTGDPSRPVTDVLPGSGYGSAPGTGYGTPNGVQPPEGFPLSPFKDYPDERYINLCEYVPRLDNSNNGLLEQTYLRTFPTYNLPMGADQPVLTDTSHCLPDAAGVHDHSDHLDPTQYPCGMTCVFAIVADVDEDPLDGGFKFPTTLYGHGNFYTAFPVPDAQSGGQNIMLPDGRTVAEVLPHGLAAGDILNSNDNLAAYNAWLHVLANAGRLPVQANSSMVFPEEDLRHEKLQTSDLYLVVFENGGPRPIQEDITLDQDKGGRDTTGDGIIDDGIPGDTVTQGLVQGRVHKVTVVEGNWANGDARGFLWLTGVNGNFLPGDLLVDGVKRATITAIGQALPIIWEAPDDPDVTFITHDCRHLPTADDVLSLRHVNGEDKPQDYGCLPPLPPVDLSPYGQLPAYGCKISRGGTVQIEARVRDGFSREQRDYHWIEYPDPLSSILVEKCVSPDELIEPGGEVTYWIRVTNTSLGEVRITEIDDPVVNGLIPEFNTTIEDYCDVELPVYLEPFQFFTCNVTVSIEGEGGDIIKNKVTVSGRDEQGFEVEDDDSAEVKIIKDIKPLPYKSCSFRVGFIGHFKTVSPNDGTITESDSSVQWGHNAEVGSFSGNTFTGSYNTSIFNSTLMFTLNEAQDMITTLSWTEDITWSSSSTQHFAATAANIPVNPLDPRSFGVGKSEEACNHITSAEYSSGDTTLQSYDCDEYSYISVMCSE